MFICDPWISMRCAMFCFSLAVRFVINHTVPLLIITMATPFVSASYELANIFFSVISFSFEKPSQRKASRHAFTYWKPNVDRATKVSSKETNKHNKAVQSRAKTRQNKTKNVYGDFDNFLKTTQLQFVVLMPLNPMLPVRLLLLLLRVSVSVAQVRCDLFSKQ